jgi:multiple sugar transport system permease protein
VRLAGDLLLQQSLLVVMTLAYKLGLERNELGIASAGSIVLLIATIVLTVIVQAWRRRGAPR